MIGRKNRVVVDCVGGGEVSIQVKIKNKTEFDWPKSGLNWCNDYSKTSEEIPSLKK